jgi:hypothetical protein
MSWVCHAVHHPRTASATSSLVMGICDPPLQGRRVSKVSPRPSRAEMARGVTADRWSWPTSRMSIILHNRDIRSHFSDRKPASSLEFLGWVGVVMSPFYPESDLESTLVSFSPSVRRRCCSQVGQDVLRQEAAVLRYARRGIRTTRAQPSAPFSGRTLDVLAPLHLAKLATTSWVCAILDEGRL